MGMLNKRTLSLPARFFRRFFTLAAVSMLLFGCTSDDSNSSSGVLGSCRDCSIMASPSSIDSFRSQSTYFNVWPVQIYASQLLVDMAYYTPGASSSYNLYRGPVAIYGQMTVSGSAVMTDSAGYCRVQPGTYELKTVSVGQINQGADFEVPELVAGPMILRMRSSGSTPSMLYRSAGNGQVRWTGVLEIVSVDGRPCSNFYSAMN
jgi:hypothetical protein